MIEILMQIVVIGFVIAYVCEWIYVTYMKD